MDCLQKEEHRTAKDPSPATRRRAERGRTRAARRPAAGSGPTRARAPGLRALAGLRGAGSAGRRACRAARRRRGAQRLRTLLRTLDAQLVLHVRDAGHVLDALLRHALLLSGVHRAGEDHLAVADLHLDVRSVDVGVLHQRLVDVLLDARVAAPVALGAAAGEAAFAALG